MRHGIGQRLGGKQQDHIRVDKDFPSTLATKTRTARTCSGTAGIVMLWRNSAADIKDTDPPRPASARTGREQRRRRTDALSTPPAASS
jgi:hypothetical protein